MKPAKKCEKSHEKLNRIKQIRQDKVKKTAIQKQLLGTGNSAPFLVCVLALSENVDPLKVVAMAQNAEPESEIVIFNYKYHHFKLVFILRDLKSNFDCIIRSENTFLQTV